MNAEYKKAAEKLLCGITDKRLHEPTIWNDILSSVRSGKLRLWEINDEILRIKYFCKEKIERASAFTESDKSSVRFDDLNAYFVKAIKSQDKRYFEAFIRAYEPVLQSRAERFVSHYNLSADDTEDIKQIFLETLWFALLGYDAVDPIPLLQYVKKAAVMRQLDYIRSIKTRDLIFGVGPAGTGKTYLAMAMAVSEFLSGRVNRIVLTRPARESGENLGFLPGSLEEKILPYLRPLYDALYDMLSPDEARDLVERGIIEVAPLAFMRGRTLNNSFIILDEAQNTTVEQMFMLLTRMGYNSKCVVTGDPTQNDLKNDERSGLLHAINTLSGISEIAICRFNTSDVVRNSLLEKIINAYNKPESGVEEL